MYTITIHDNSNIVTILNKPVEEGESYWAVISKKEHTI